MTDNKTRKPHTLGAILMRISVMNKSEIQHWLSTEGYTKEEIEQIRNDVIRQRTEKPAPFSYGKVY